MKIKIKLINKFIEGKSDSLYQDELFKGFVITKGFEVEGGYNIIGYNLPEYVIKEYQKRYFKSVDIDGESEKKDKQIEQLKKIIIGLEEQREEENSPEEIEKKSSEEMIDLRKQVEDLTNKTNNQKKEIINLKKQKRSVEKLNQESEEKDLAFEELQKNFNLLVEEKNKISEESEYLTQEIINLKEQRKKIVENLKPRIRIAYLKYNEEHKHLVKTKKHFADEKKYRKIEKDNFNGWESDYKKLFIKNYLDNQQDVYGGFSIPELAEKYNILKHHIEEIKKSQVVEEKKEQTEDTQKEIPEEIKQGGLKESKQPEQQSKEKGKKLCKYCGEKMHPLALRCKECRRKIRNIREKYKKRNGECDMKRAIELYEESIKYSPS